MPDDPTRDAAGNLRHGAPPLPERDVVFSTARLVVRPWRAAEAGRLLDIRSRPDVARWLSDPEPWDDVEHARSEIRRWAGPPVTGSGLGIWAIVPRATDTPAGTVSLKHLPDSDEIEVGWYLHPDATGCGYAREAAAAALAHAADAGVPRVWAIMWPENAASVRVATAIGMVDLGIQPDPWYGTPEYPDSRMFRADLPA